MDVRKRVTLDSIGQRPRARVYASVYEPKMAKAVRFVDVSRPTRIKLPTTHLATLRPITTQAISPDNIVAHAKTSATSLLTFDSAHMAKASPRQYSSVSYHPQSIIEANTPADGLQAVSISQLVESIQTKTISGNFAVNEPTLSPDSSISMARNSKFKLKKLLTRKSTYISVAALFLIAGGFVSLLLSTKNNSLVQTQVKALSEKSAATESNAEGSKPAADVPSETPITETVASSYSVAPDLPRYITIPKIKNGRSRVLRLGLDDEGKLKTPRNVWDTAWYDGSSKPGDKIGAALIMGHVSGPTNGGVFYNLYRLTTGDEIKVTMGDGTVLTYIVVDKEEVPADSIEMTKYLVSKNVDKAGLTLMTCAGEFDAKTQTYDKRLAIFAIRKD